MRRLRTRAYIQVQRAAEVNADLLVEITTEVKVDVISKEFEYRR